MRIHLKTTNVLEIIEENEDYQIIRTESRKTYSICYVSLSGKVEPGDKVLINTTAVDLSLGTGGLDFVVAVFKEGEHFLESEPESHVMKLNYTPMQFSIPHFEETDEYIKAVEIYRKTKKKLPVFVLTVHSHIIPFLLGLREFHKGKKCILIINDSCALPVFASKTIRFALNEGLIEKVITCGNAFGGSVETVNIYSALISSAYAFEADIIAVAPGYGLKGTGSAYGHSAVDFVEVVNASASLGFSPYLVPRISFAEKRERHLGISHHTLEIIELSLKKPDVILPALDLLDENQRTLLSSQISSFKESAVLRYVDFKSSFEILKPFSELLTSMGRKFSDDPIFFAVPASASKALE